MITGISIENFKGIRERVEIEFRPLTLLFGANSAGKSSILHTLHYAREVFERRNLDADQTIAGGKYIDLGGFHRLVHRYDIDTTAIPQGPIRLRFDVAVSPDDLKSFDAEIDGLIARTLSRLNPHREHVPTTLSKLEWLQNLQFNTLFDEFTTAAVELEIAWSSVRGCPYVAKNTIYFDDEPFVQLEANPQLRGVLIKVDFSVCEGSGPEGVRHVSAFQHKRLKRVQDSESDDHGRTLFEVLFEYCNDLFSDPVGQIELIGRIDALPPLDRVLPFSPMDVSRPDEIDWQESLEFRSHLASELVRALSQFVVGLCCFVRDELVDFRYLGPLREPLPRAYTPPRFPDPARWASGLGAWDALFLGNDELVEAVGSWLGDEDKLDAKCTVERRHAVSLDYSHPIVQVLSGNMHEDKIQDDRWDLLLAATKSRVAVISNSCVELHPHEVGIGISQIVPVIVTALDQSQRLLAIEQPELHVHPRLQAAMGDLFIDAINGNKHRFIIETHSEHLILRLQRRIRETTKGNPIEGRSLVSEDVVVYHVSSEEGGTRLRRIDVDRKGDFIQPWPDDFFEIDFFERFGHDR